MTDRELLRAFVRDRSSRNFRPLVERYLALVYSSACRQTGAESPAAQVTGAIFIALAHRAKSLPRRTVLAGWLFRATRLGCVKLLGRAKGPPRVPPSNESPLAGTALNPAPWTKFAPHIDEA